MKQKIWMRLFAITAILALSVLFLSQTSPVFAAADARGGPAGRGGGGAAGGAGGSAAGQARSAVTPLSEAEVTALQDAILEEYGALNLYQSVIAQFGDVYPFSQIARAEQQHVNALLRQAAKYGVSSPANPGLAEAPTFANLAEACQAGVDAEIADAALYDQLKPLSTHSDLNQVYTNLQKASLNNHLPAFDSCN